MTGPLNLDSPEVVDGLLRDLAVQFHNHVLAVALGAMSSVEVAEEEERVCHQLARTFTGLDDHYQPLIGWNTDGGLVQTLRAAIDLPPQADEREDATVFFTLRHFGNEVYRLLLDAEAEDQTPDQMVTEINALIERYVGLFMKPSADSA